MDDDQKTVDVSGVVSDDEVEQWFEDEETPPPSTAENVDIVQRYSDAQLHIVRSTMGSISTQFAPVTSGRDLH
jgi:hypothetical protein